MELLHWINEYWAPIGFIIGLSFTLGKMWAKIDTTARDLQSHVNESSERYKQLMSRMDTILSYLIK